MTITAADIKFRKSETVTDTGVNGGRKGRVEKITGARHALFPRVTKAERIAGVTRYRKEFWTNENADDESAFEVLIFLEYPSVAQDYFYIGLGTQIDTQSDILATPPLWTGCGQLNTALAGAETSVELLMENNDFEFAPGGTLHLSDKVLTSQTVDSAVKAGDSVQNTAGTWYKIAAQGDISDPYGIYLGNNKVLSDHPAAQEEFLTMATNLVTDENIGTGNGSDNSPALSNLTSVVNGLVTQEDYLATIKVKCGGTERTVYIQSDGSCTGYCSAGQINADTGVWISNIVWTTTPDNGENILATYYDKNYSYSGNVVTILLNTAVANSYATAGTYGSGCLHSSEVRASIESWTETTASGTYDESTYPPVLFNDGVEYDTYTITFTSATAFTCAGTNIGSLGSGVITADFSPTNPNTGQPLFTIDKDGWGGSWVSGETVQFVTNPAALPIWWKEVVPAGALAEPDNTVILGWYSE